MRDAVLPTDRVLELIDCLRLVAERIDRQWAEQGEAYLRTAPVEAPDPNDPAVIRRRRIDQLELDEKLAAHMHEVIDLVVEAEDIHEATSSVAALLGVDDMAVQVRLLSFPVFGLTRGGRAAQARALLELREIEEG